MYVAKGYSITIGHCFSISWKHKLIYINNYTLIPYPTKEAILNNYEKTMAYLSFN